MYRILFSPRADREFRKLVRDVQERLTPIIASLANQPRPPGCKKLSNKDPHWRVRVGDYRIIYQIADEALIVLIVRVGHRREIYR
jgi:mRNA interferase RelE/StbE